MDLASMIENSTKEESGEINFITEDTNDSKLNMLSPDPDIDHVKMMDEDCEEKINSTTEENTVDCESTQSDSDQIISEVLGIDIVDFKKHIESNIDKLQYTKYIAIASDDISNNDGIVILKSMEENKNIIQLYKDMCNYNIFDHDIDYMKLFGENGFVIKYESKDNYHWKLYGTKSSMCVTLFIDIDDKQYPLYFEKFTRTKFDKIEWPDDFHLMSVEEYTDRLDDNSSFDIEDCCILYPPLHKKANELSTKKLVMDRLYEILVKTYDVAHCIKIINTMIHTI